MVDRLKPMVKQEQSVETFYDQTVEKIVKQKMSKFTYGSEVEIGGMLPGEEMPETD
jgi:hypothetical protein